MLFYCAFSGSEVCPGEHRQTKIDDGGVHRVELVLEAKASLLSCGNLLTALQKFEEKIAIDLVGPMFVGLGECRAFRSIVDAEVSQFAETTLETSADFTQGLGLGDLTEEHCDKLIPASESFCVSFGFVFMHDIGEIIVVKERKYLTEKACC